MKLSDNLQKFLDSRELFGWQLGLTRIARLAKSFGNPERRFQVIHLAGTNGKGSTAAMLEAVLKAAGYRTGLYTSPHLVHVVERIRIAGAPIDLPHFEALLTKQRSLLEKERATYFEALTTVAFAAFAESNVDVAVIEVGLGGRLDATNIVQPRLCVMAHIALDHQQILGRSLAKIAAEKAGILKRRVPCIVGKMPITAMREIRSRAQALQAPVYEAWRMCKLREATITEDGNRLALTINSAAYEDLRCRLAGGHQINNTLCVIAAVHVLNQCGLQISESALRHGLANVDWPGRFQLAQKQPRVIYDVAHNPAGMEALVETFREIYPNQPPIVVIGILADKDHVKMLQQWKGAAKKMIFCKVQSKRGQLPEELYRTAEKLRLPAEVIVEPREAVQHAKKLAGAKGVVCVTGSHYLIGQILAKRH